MKSNKEILEQAIQKAIDGGWNGNYYHALTIADTFPEGSMTKQVIFNHDFAKALWGYHGVNKDNGLVVEEDISNPLLPADGHVPNFTYHLQQMVIAEDPIKYLGENI